MTFLSLFIFLITETSDSEFLITTVLTVGKKEVITFQIKVDSNIGCAQ